MKDELEVFLITYNRKDYLEKTLDCILNRESPIRDLSITILDNKSTDGSTELIQSKIKGFDNIKHIVHNRNIGGNANIARCYELAQKKYFWILCDDDEIDWGNWKSVEEAITNNADAVIVSNYLNPKENVAQLLAQMSFVPAGIYKSSFITDTVMQNVGFQISTMFPQMALACKLINENADIIILDEPIVIMQEHPTVASYTRGMDSDKSPLLSNQTWSLGFLKSLQLIKNIEIIEFVIENLYIQNRECILHPDSFLKYNHKLGNDSFINEAEYFSMLPARFKHMFCYANYKNKDVSLPETKQFYNSSELELISIKKSKAFKLGQFLLFLPKKLLRRK